MSYEFSTTTDISQIVNTLQEFGIAVVPSYLNQEELEQLNVEFEHILEATPKKPALKKIDYSNGRGMIVKPSALQPGEFPGTQQLFSSAFMKEIKNQYLGLEGGLNTEVFVVNDVVGTSHHANDLHFDVVPTFKFFLYLTDTTKTNGAFSCVPGSHLRTDAIRAKLGGKISYKNRELSRDLPYTEDEVQSIEGKAGTLIIFTTETFHRAGKVSSGERKVMRGHCRLPQHAQPKNLSLIGKIKRLLSNA